MKALHRTSLPSYAVDLLLAAKWVAHPPGNATPEQLAKYQESLNDAVITFEARMPVCNGVVIMEHAIVDRPAYRAGAEAALSFLRKHEEHAINLGGFDPGALRTQLVALGGLHRDESRAFLYVVGAFLSQSMIGHAPYLDTWDIHAALAGIVG